MSAGETLHHAVHGTFGSGDRVPGLAWGTPRLLQGTRYGMSSVGISSGGAPTGSGTGFLGHGLTSGHIPVAAWFTFQCCPCAYRETVRWGEPPCSRWNG